MALKFYLDDIDITEEIANQGYALPASVTEEWYGIYPSKDSGTWFDLLRVINENKYLSDGFFDGGAENGTHTLVILEDTGKHFECRLQLRKKYTARNR